MGHHFTEVLLKLLFWRTLQILARHQLRNNTVAAFTFACGKQFPPSCSVVPATRKSRYLKRPGSAFPNVIAPKTRFTSLY